MPGESTGAPHTSTAMRIAHIKAVVGISAGYRTLPATALYREKPTGALYAARMKALSNVGWRVFGWARRRNAAVGRGAHLRRVHVHHGDRFPVSDFRLRSHLVAFEYRQRCRAPGGSAKHGTPCPPPRSSTSAKEIEVFAHDPMEHGVPGDSSSIRGADAFETRCCGCRLCAHDVAD